MPQIRLPQDSAFGYHPSLDGLRAVAVLSVMLLHAFVPFHLVSDIKILGVGGFLGVDIFFVLSGFLITSLLVREWEKCGRIDIRNFYARRALRLLPALYVFLAFCIAHSVLFRDAAESSGAMGDAASITFYLSNWIPINLYTLRHTWSLAVEEQFYLVYPLLLSGLLYLMAAGRMSRRGIIVLIGSLLSIIAIYRAALFAVNGFSMRIYMGSDTRADSLLVGCLAALTVTWGMYPRRAFFLKSVRVCGAVSAIVIFVMIFTAKFDADYMYYGGYTLVAGVVATVIVSLQVSPVPALRYLLERSPLVWIGQISYGIYLWHKLVYVVVDSVMPSVPLNSYTLQRIVLPVAAKLVFSLSAAALSYYLLEKPFLRLKSRFAPRPSFPARRTLPVEAAQGTENLSLGTSVDAEVLEQPLTSAAGQ